MKPRSGCGLVQKGVRVHRKKGLEVSATSERRLETLVRERGRVGMELKAWLRGTEVEGLEAQG